MEYFCVKAVWGSALWEQVKPHTIRFGTDTCYIDADCIFEVIHLICPKLRGCIVQGVFTNHKKFQINACTKQVLLHIVSEWGIVTSVAEFTV